MEKQPDFNSRVNNRVETDKDYSKYIESIRDNIFTLGTIEAVLNTYANDDEIPVSDKIFQYQELLPEKRVELNKNVDSAIEHIKKLVSEEIEHLSDED